MTIDKPWETEPDELIFIDEETGLECIIKRHPELGFLRGYVVLPKGKELHLIYDEDIDVHGDITFSDNLKSYNNKFAVGFHCAHGEDFIPFAFDTRASVESPVRQCVYKETTPYPGETYKDIEFVTAECKKLAKQLKERIDGRD